MPLTTTLVGALPKRSYVPLRDLRGGFVHHDRYVDEYRRFQKQHICAVILEVQEFLAVLKQIEIGIDVLTEGALPRIAYWEYTVYAMDGVTVIDDRPTVTGPVRLSAPTLVPDWRLAQSYTGRPVKIAMAGPATLSEYVEDRHYGDKRKMCRDFAQAVNVEVRGLYAAGCRWIQLDEPQLGFKPEMALDYGLEMVDACFAGIPDDCHRVVHICRGYARVDGSHEGRNPVQPYAKLAGALEECSANVVSIEDASQYHDDLSFLETFEKTSIMFGSVSNLDTNIETVEQIRVRLGSALEHIDPGRLIVAPDCGFGNYCDENASFVWRKLANMVEAARSL